LAAGRWPSFTVTALVGGKVSMLGLNEARLSSA
jgi:hypothetical protein